MKDLNRVQLIGHVGHDPETKYTDRGTARTTFSVATSARGKDADGQAQEATEWTRCVAWAHWPRSMYGFPTSNPPDGSYIVSPAVTIQSMAIRMMGLRCRYLPGVSMWALRRFW